MKLATLQTADGTLIAAVEGPDTSPRYLPLNWIDLTLPRSLREILAEETGLLRCRAALKRARDEKRTVNGTLLPPITDPGKVICIGLNYRDHALETGQEAPSEPICFGKFGNTIIGPQSAVRLPRAAQTVDYEAELVVVIGKRAYEVPQESAFEYVAGYCNGNDVSARDWQIGRPGKQWLLGKSPDTFAPIGPWLVTKDEITNPHDLQVTLRLNGNTMQQGNTSQFIFGVDALIAHLTKLITLEPGDLIFTGTPPGVGMARKPPIWLAPGDRMEVEIQGLGILSNPVVGPDER